MSSKSARGFTLIEMIIAMVVIAVGLAGVLSAFSTVRGSADPLIEKQMLALAEEMMEEVMLKPYAPPAINNGAIAGCDRRNADDIADYNGYFQATCTIDGTAMGAPLDGYTTTVTVTPAAFAGIPAGAAPAAGASLVTVTVTHVATGRAVALSGWRANYAANLPQ